MAKPSYFYLLFSPKVLTIFGFSSNIPLELTHDDKMQYSAENATRENLSATVV